MKENIVLDLLKTSVSLEIENDYAIKDDCIEINLPNGEIAVLTVTETDSASVDKQTVRVNDYVYNHDYGEMGGDVDIKLLLRNLKDVEDYAIDVSQISFEDVQVIDNVVIMPNEPIYKIVVSIKS